MEHMKNVKDKVICMIFLFAVSRLEDRLTYSNLLGVSE